VTIEHATAEKPEHDDTRRSVISIALGSRPSVDRTSALLSAFYAARFWTIGVSDDRSECGYGDELI
jgi:hypothetical protein